MHSYVVDKKIQLGENSLLENQKPKYGCEPVVINENTRSPKGFNMNSHRRSRWIAEPTINHNPEGVE